MSQAAALLAELLAEKAKLERQYEGACFEARSVQIRADDAESQLDDKSRVKVDATRAMEREEQKRREMDLQEESDQLMNENAKLRSTETRLMSKIDELEGRLREYEPAAEVPAIRKEPKEEPIESQDDNQIIAHDPMEEEEPFEVDEVPNDDVLSGLEETEVEPPFSNDDSALRTMQPSDLMNHDMNFTGEMAEVCDPCVAEIDSLEMENVECADGLDQSEISGNERKNSLADDGSDNESDTTIDNLKDSSEEEEIEWRTNGRPSRRVSRAVTYAESPESSDGDESPEDSDEDEEPPVKRSKSRKTSSNKAPYQPAVKNATDLECPKCEHRTRSVSGWLWHLRDAHSTTSTLAGVTLRCDCGMECFTDDHLRTCKIANLTVIRKKD